MRLYDVFLSSSDSIAINSLKKKKMALPTS